MIATGSTAFALQVQALKEENTRLRTALEHISRMKTLPDHVYNTFTLVAAHELANRALYPNEYLEVDMYSKKETIIQEYISQSPHTRHCSIRVGDNVDNCDCGLKYLRESTINAGDSLEYCIISDGDSHLYVCPADRAKEAQDTFEAIVKYWRDCDYDKECPPEPGYVKAIGGSYSLVKFKQFRID